MSDLTIQPAIYSGSLTAGASEMWGMDVTNNTPYALTYSGGLYVSSSPVFDGTQEYASSIYSYTVEPYNVVVYNGDLPFVAPSEPGQYYLLVSLIDNMGGGGFDAYQISVVGDGPITYTGGFHTINLSALPGRSVLLSNTGGNWDWVSGSNGTVALNSAQTTISGGGDGVIFASGSGNFADLFNTGVGNWDWVSGSNGTVALNSAQATISGGGDGVIFASGSGNFADLFNTGVGNWDWVSGSNGTVALNSAQATISGGADGVIFAGGSGNFADLFNTGVGNWDWVSGSNGTVALNSAQTTISGGSDGVIFASGSGNFADLFNTGVGNWDWVSGSNGTVALNSAQTTISGGADGVIFAGSSGNIATLNGTGGNWDWVAGSNGTIGLNNAQTFVTGGNDTVSFVGTSAVTLSGASDVLTFQQGIGGKDVVNGFSSTDAIELSHLDFASWSALSSHISQSGANTVIALGPSDTITLTNFAAASLIPSQFHFE